MFHCAGKNGLSLQVDGLEYTFGMRSCALSEVFWEVLESFYEKQGHIVLDLQVGLLVRRADMSDESIH